MKTPVNGKMKMNFITGKIWLKTLVAVFVLAASPVMAQAEATPTPHRVLIKNISIFNGIDKTLITGKDVVLAGNKIDRLVDAGDASGGYDLVIDGKGGYLTPGLIDAHCYAVFGSDEEIFFNGDPAYVQIFAAKEMGEMLMRGVTTIRDQGGNTFGLTYCFLMRGENNNFMT